MKEITVHLNSEDALSTGILAAVADKHKLKRVRISYNLHNTVVKTFRFGRSEDDPVLSKFCDVYDASALANLEHGDKCGILYGTPVVLDDYLASRSLVIESEPY